MKKILIVLSLLSQSVFAQREPIVTSTYTFTDQYCYDLNFEPSSKFIGTKDFHVLSGIASYNYNTIVIDGNIRYLSQLHLNDSGKIFIHPNSDCIFTRLKFGKCDTIYNYGKINISVFESLDTLYLINEPGGEVYSDSHQWNNGDIIPGNCNIGRIIIVEGNDLLTTSINNSSNTDNIKWNNYMIVSLDGKVLSMGNYNLLQSSMQNFKGLFLIKLWNKFYIKTIKTYIR